MKKQNRRICSGTALICAVLLLTGCGAEKSVTVQQIEAQQQTAEVTALQEETAEEAALDREDAPMQTEAVLTVGQETAETPESQTAAASAAGAVQTSAGQKPPVSAAGVQAPSANLHTVIVSGAAGVPAAGGQTVSTGTVNGEQQQADKPVDAALTVDSKSEDEWLAQAQEMLFTADELAYRYLSSGSGFSFSRDLTDNIDRTYFRTVYTTAEEATAPYYEVFSHRVHAHDFDRLLVVSNGGVYASRASRGMDLTYLSSTVTAVERMSEEEIVFLVDNEYEDGITQSRLSLVKDEDGVWRIGVYEQPY